MRGTFAITTEEGGLWKARSNGMIHSIWFEDGRQWDAVNGYRGLVRPVTFADKVNLILAEAFEKLDALWEK